MLTYKEYLEEKFHEISLMKNAEKSLPDEIVSGIKTWEFHSWTTGALEHAYRNKTENMEKIEHAMRPIREAMKKRLGGKYITLYRGINTEREAKPDNSRVLYSWTSRPKYAALFANIAVYGSKGIKPVVDPENSHFFHLKTSEIEKGYADLKKNGVAKIGKFTLKSFPDSRRWHTVYIGTKEYEYGGDSDTLVRDFLSRKHEDIQRYEEAKKRGHVVKQKILIDDVVWIFDGGRNTTAGASMEYVVKNQSGNKGTKIDPFTEREKTNV